MDKKFYKDLFICVLLVGTLFSAAFFVSCSEDNAILTGPNNNNNGNYGNGGGATTEALSSFFGSIGEGAANEIGADIDGWVLSAMGLAGSSPDYEKQIGLIINDLDSIINLLNGISTELSEINQTLLTLNCSEQSSTLQTELGRIGDLYSQYNSMVETAQSGDTIPKSLMQDWVDQVLARNAYASQQSVGVLLSTIEINLTSQSGALYSCIVAAPHPGTFGTTAFGTDSNYYNNVEALTNYYYYYQAIALAMISEAYHYDAWVAACGNGKDSCSFSADSIQAVCNVNGTSLTYCNEVKGYTNTVYNSLLTQFSFGGASYTNDNTILQYIENNPVVWVRSLEDFNKQAGYNCPDPLTNSIMDPITAQPCGPAMGCAFSVLSDTVYRGTSGFSYANGQELYNLVDATASQSFNTNGLYLESKGFKNMSGKTIISVNPGNQFVFSESQETLTGTPFFFTDQKAFTSNGELISVYYSGNAFNYTIISTVLSNGTCQPSGSYSSPNMTIGFATNPIVERYDTTFTNEYSYCLLCYGNPNLPNGGWIVETPLTWGFPNVSSNSTPPGYVAQSNSSCERKRNRFLMPKVNALDAHCKSGRLNVNIGNVPTMCGEDFNIFLNTNVPRPPTCNSTNISPPCTTLN